MTVRVWAGRLVTDAERIAHSISHARLKAKALCGVARALAATDSDRAELLLIEAGSIAYSITGSRS